MRTLVETAALAGERGAYRLTRAVQRSRCPPTVQAILAARIDRLAPEDKRAAPDGRGHRQGRALRRCSQAIAELPRTRRCGAGSCTCRPRSSSTRPDSSPISSTPSSTRSPMRSRTGDCYRSGGARCTPAIVEAIEQLYADRLAEHVERLAHHALRGELWEKAVCYLRQAGQRAMAAGRQPRWPLPAWSRRSGPSAVFPRRARDDRADHRHPPRRSARALTRSASPGAHGESPPRGQSLGAGAWRPAPARRDRHLHDRALAGDRRLDEADRFGQEALTSRDPSAIVSNSRLVATLHGPRLRSPRRLAQRRDPPPSAERRRSRQPRARALRRATCIQSAVSGALARRVLLPSSAEFDEATGTAEGAPRR